MPGLLPGILELSERARYFSFHAFLLDEYQRRRLTPDRRRLSEFIKKCEWDLGLAVLRCPRRCGSSPVGSTRLRGLAKLSGLLPRGESVKSALGGYGLYYRTPLAEFGIVAKAGELHLGEPLPIDVLRSTDRALRLATRFRSAIAHTRYYGRFMLSSDELPTSVVEEYAEAACLCRLRDLPSERDAVHDAMFGVDPADHGAAQAVSAVDSGGGGNDAGPDSTQGAPGDWELDDRSGSTSDPIQAAVRQRRRAVGHYLTLVDAEPEVVTDVAAFREMLWAPPPARSPEHEVVAGQWAALIAKDVWQEAICSVWSEFCRAGLERHRQLDRGLTWEETRQLARGLLDGPPQLAEDELTTSLQDELFPGGFYHDDLASAPLEALRLVAVESDSATCGLLVLLELARRTAGRADVGWRQAAYAASVWQPSLAAVLGQLREHLEAAPTVADTLWWLVSTFVLRPHENIAYSKLPDFTFRFRWDDNLLHFYDYGETRFGLAAIRHEPLKLLTRDLGFWDEDPHGEAQLTTRGAAFVAEVLA